MIDLHCVIIVGPDLLSVDSLAQ